MKYCDLTNKKCLPCEGGVEPLNNHETQRLLSTLGEGWQLNSTHHLFKEYKFNDFMGAMRFANKIASVAESEGHHPDLIIRWGKCSVELWTHAVGGLTENDFIVAAKIDAHHCEERSL